MGDLEALALRCGQARGPDRELDADICVAALGFVERKCLVEGWRDFDRPSGHRVTASTTNRAWQVGEPWTTFDVPPLTASLDAALTLVPDGFTFTVARWWCDGEDRPPFFADCADLEKCKAGEDCDVQQAWAATPALALCAAALRTHASMNHPATLDSMKG